MKNKEAAISFLKLVTDGKIREAYGLHASPNLKHHNPYNKGDVQSLMAGMEEAEHQFPNKVFRIRQALQEGDLVAVHSHLTLKAGELELAVVHLFRFEADRIIEFWDVAQQVPKDSVNENGMF